MPPTVKKSHHSRKSIVHKRSDCPVTGVLDLLGDKWTLLVIRDMLFFGKTLYKELAASSEKIPTNILADRLRRLEDAGLLVKRAYQEKPRRFSYHLTRKGCDVLPILREIRNWSFKHVSGVSKPDEKRMAEIRKNIRNAMKRG